MRERIASVGWPELPGYFSQGGQDRFINELVLREQRNGFFIDIGANDGLTFSNTCFFEFQLGWSGVCLEPNPISYRRLCANRTCKCIQACIGATDGMIAFPVVADSHASLFASARKCGVHPLVDVPMLTLPTLFRQAGVERVDFLSLDIEGGELEVFSTIADTGVRPRCVSIEQNAPPEEMDMGMSRFGYNFIAKLFPDRIYVAQ